MRSLDKTAHTYDYKQSNEVSDIIYDIIGKVDKHLVSQTPDLAIVILKGLIKIDGKLFDHIDDSYGYLGTAYYSLYEVLDKAFTNSNETPEEIAKYVIETYLHDDYGNRSDILKQINTCLQGEKALVLEKVIANYNMEPYYQTAIRKKLSDLSGDVDKYIQAIKNDGHLDSSDICDIAERLLKANRPQEAIDWLLKIKNGNYGARSKDSLLVEAYQSSGSKEKAQQLRWEIFKKHCYIDDYKAYIKYIPKKEMKLAEANAIKVAQDVEYLSYGVSFLKEMKLYGLVEALLLKRFDEVNGEDYHTYRSLSTSLTKHGKYLIASLLRRKIAQCGVAKAQSKYYKYAASDYKLCSDYASKVKDWDKFPTHDEFVKSFKEAHKRKKAFWALIK